MLYFKSAKEVNHALPLPKGKYAIEWFDPRANKLLPVRLIVVKDAQGIEIKLPSNDDQHDWVCMVKKVD